MLYSVLDLKANAFGRLIEARTDEEAIRSFLIAIQNSSKQDLIGLYPQDFAMFKIGNFDITTGFLTQDVSPVQLITGLECVQMLRGLNNTSSECCVSVSDANDVSSVTNGNEEEV